ncbi:MAG: transaldolase family protein [Eubacteriales bacterium]|nr:transaldolase family protein [Eubacteriales bacterium]
MNEYLLWLANETNSVWWNDSAILSELEFAIAHGAQGVTTNPVLVSDAIYNDKTNWKPYLDSIPANIEKSDKAELIIQKVTCRISDMFLPIYEMTNKCQGYVCAQVDPSKVADRSFMLQAAQRINKWARNIAVKLPVTAAGLDVLEECAALGITVTATVSFTMSQVVAVGERYQKGLKRARSAGITPGKCFAVIMVGRIDDYIRDVIYDSKMNIAESDIIQCGNLIIKNAYKYFKQNGFEATLMPAGMRGRYQAEALSGGEMSMSINPKIQVMLPLVPKPYVIHIDDEIDKAVLDRLMKVSEFARAYEVQGMKPEEFISYGVVQRTLAQFIEHWKRIEEYSPGG